MKTNTWITGLIATTAGLSLLHRYGLHSGASWTEYKQRLLGDDVVPYPDLEITNAISIQAPTARIWPWLVQMGYCRGGWFTDSTWKGWDDIPDKLMRFFEKKPRNR